MTEAITDKSHWLALAEEAYRSALKLSDSGCRIAMMGIAAAYVAMADAVAAERESRSERRPEGVGDTDEIG